MSASARTSASNEELSEAQEPSPVVLCEHGALFGQCAGAGWCMCQGGHAVVTLPGDGPCIGGHMATINQAPGEGSKGSTTVAHFSLANDPYTKARRVSDKQCSITQRAAQRTAAKQSQN